MEMKQDIKSKGSKYELRLKEQLWKEHLSQYLRMLVPPGVPKYWTIFLAESDWVLDFFNSYVSWFISHSIIIFIPFRFCQSKKLLVKQFLQAIKEFMWAIKVPVLGHLAHMNSYIPCKYCLPYSFLDWPKRIGMKVICYVNLISLLTC